MAQIDHEAGLSRYWSDKGHFGRGGGCSFQLPLSSGSGAEASCVGWLFETRLRSTHPYRCHGVQVRPLLQRRGGGPMAALCAEPHRCEPRSLCFLAEGERVEDEAEDGSQINEEELLEDAGLAGALEARVKYLEDTLQSVHVGMEEMVKLQKQSMGITSVNPGRPSALKKKEQSVAAGLPTAKAVPKSKQKDKYPLLDQGVVQAALQARVPESNLLEMQRLIGSNVKASRVKDVNVNFTMDPLSEEEGGEDGAHQEAAGSGLAQEPVSKDPVHNALHKLTTIMEVLTNDKVKKNSGSRLEQALDSAASSSGDTQSLGSGRKNAAARRALRTIFQEQPQEISAVIEFRSRIGNFKTPAHCSWSAAGILDSLISGDVARARARCCLMLLQLDQASIDRGGWGLASELSLEGLPPYSALATTLLRW